MPIFRDNKITNIKNNNFVNLHNFKLMHMIGLGGFS
jgi:hypothetical protein